MWDEKTRSRVLTKSDTVYSSIAISVLETRIKLPEWFGEIKPKLAPGAYIAGGCLASALQHSEVSDIDIFFQSTEAFSGTVSQFESNPEWTKTELTEDQKKRYVEFKHEKHPKVQLINVAWFSSAEQLIDTFDFTVTQFAIDGDSFIFNPLSFIDLNNERLAIHKVNFPASSLRRMVKYLKKGFNGCMGFYIDFSNKIAETLKEHPEANDAKVYYVD